MAKPAVIAPLTGIRLLAAIWVVLFHIYLYNGDDLSAMHPLLNAVVGPIVSQGDLGVDLFFLLSGFVLAHNYLDRFGPRPSLPDAVRFLWLRLARVWPLYMVAIGGAGLLLFVRLELWGTQPNVPLSWGQFLAQALMVQQWGAPNVPNTSWAGPGWSISAEWLAYLCFPALAVVVWRLRQLAGRGMAMVLVPIVLLPTLVWTAGAHTQAAPFMWLARLASEFTAGMLLSAALPPGTRRLQEAATWLAPRTLMLGAAWLYVAALLDRPWLGPSLVALFPLLVLTLALGDGRLHRWLSSPPMVLGGGVSFALYLVHVPLLKLFREALQHGLVPLAPQHRLYGELAVAGLSLVLAYLLFRYVEEPARHRLRALTPQVTALVSRRQGSLPSSWSDGSLRAHGAEEHGLEQQARQVLR